MPRPFKFFIPALFLFLVSCQRSVPLDFAPGDFQCEFCKMAIVDMRFKTEVLSPKGKVHHFDSIECMTEWSRQHPQEVQSRWVTDFYHPEKWISFEHAYFLKSGKISSPMGAHLSAYSTAEELEQAKKEFGGVAIERNQL